MDTTDTPTNEPNAPRRAYWRRVLIAFFVTFLWLGSASIGMLDWIALPSSAQFLFEVFVPALACVAFLHPTSLFRDRPASFRTGILCLIGVVIVTSAFALVALCAIVRFAVRAASGT